MGNRQCRRVIFERKEINEMSPLDCFDLLPGESFQATVQGGGKFTEETEFIVQGIQDS